MLPSRFLTLAGSLVLAMVVLGIVTLRARHKDAEEDLLTRIQREGDPVKKAKYEIRLAQLKLEQATAAYNQGRLDEGGKLLDAYLHWIDDAWKSLKGSGRDASRKPSGFKELDIALRENARQLEDLQHRVPYTDRGPLDRVAHEIDKTHNEVLAALFPKGALAPPAVKKNAVMPSQATRLRFMTGSLQP